MKAPETKRTREASRIEAEAADWLSRRQRGLTPAEVEQYSRWQAADARHALALAEVEAAWTFINRPRTAGNSAEAIALLAIRTRARQRRRQKFWVFGTASLAAAAAILMVFSPFAPRLSDRSVVETTARVTEPMRRPLPDGTMAVLNAGAEMDLAYSATERQVRVLRGEVHFTVTRDPNRPFVVTAGRVEARALGTEFSVRYSEERVEILVNEGRVAISPVAAESEPRSIPVEAAGPVVAEAGTRVIVPASVEAATPTVERISSDALAQALAWRGQRMEFSGTPLGEALSLFNRQNETQLRLAERELAGLQVSGFFWADNPEGFARLAASTFGLEVRRIDETHIEIRR